METNTLNKKWEDVSSFHDQGGYHALRISSTCIPELFIAIDEDGYRCLLLFIPKGVKIRLKGTNKEKLQLTYISENNVILIKLSDLNFIDLFNDLIISLYSKINGISDPKSYANELIQSFYKWVEFFEDSLNSKLSSEEIQGLFGELFILRNKISKCDSSSVNELLESWKGPYDDTNDFVFDDKNIEVKTKKGSKPYVYISSEFQLEKDFDKGLELLVISVIIDLTKGESINELLEGIVYETRNNLGDLAILYRALNQKGLTVESTKEYNNHRFKTLKTHLYNCTLPDFPRLSLTNIPVEITNLKYNLRINTLGDFLIEEKVY